MKMQIIEVDPEDAKALLGAVCNKFDNPPVALTHLIAVSSALAAMVYGKDALAVMTQLQPAASHIANDLVEDFNRDQQARAEKESEAAKAEGKVQ